MTKVVAALIWDKDNISRKIDVFSEEYCKLCYADSEYTYNNMDDLITTCLV